MPSFAVEFDPANAGYSRKNAYWLGRAANTAYLGSQAAKAEVATWGLTDFREIDQKDTQGFVASNAAVALLAFRGTEATKVRDWFTDADVNLVRGPVGKVHAGFRDALDDGWDDVTRGLAEIAGGRPLFVTGHSLGGALAVMATARLLFKGGGPAPTATYTFGQPRVGDSKFVGALENAFKPHWFRYVNNNDVVPRVPPRFLDLGYVDGGIVRYFDADGREQDDLGFWGKLADALKGRMKDLLKPGTDGLKDHSMDRYLANLERAKKKG